MYSFKNDYAEGAHPHILQKLIETNLVQQSGYGEDAYSIKAKEILKQKIDNPDAIIYFVYGGNKINLMIKTSLLIPHETVISANTGNIYANEAGAIQNTRHRVITIDSEDGKLKPADIENVLQAYSRRPH